MNVIAKTDSIGFRSGLRYFDIPLRNLLDPAVAAGSHIDRDELVARHERNGFAFVPHVREAIDGEVTYGDTSLSFEWIEQHAKGWDIVGYDHNLIDPLQLLVYLVPK